MQLHTCNLNICRKSCLCCSGKTVNLNKTDISVIFSLFFVYCHCNLKGLCLYVTRSGRSNSVLGNCDEKGKFG